MKAKWFAYAAVAAMFAGPVPQTEAQTYGGSATGAQVTVPATGTVIRAASGTLSISGGGEEAALLVGDIPGSATGGVVSLSAGALHAAIVGLDATRGEASMGNVALTVSGNQITADFLMARATASCGPAVSGNSQLANLVINSQAVSVTGDPNQTVTLPNGTAIINEQSSSVSGTSAELTVAALHITTRDPVTGQELADVVLAIADSMIDCQAGSSPDAAFGTGGGWVTGNAGGRANFGIVGGTEQGGTTKAHVVFDDHSVNFKMKSTTITAVNNSVPCETTIEGSGESDGLPVNFTVTIRDDGEPGAEADTISLQVSSGYTNLDMVLNGGNIKKHRENCSAP